MYEDDLVETAMTPRNAFTAMLVKSGESGYEVLDGVLSRAPTDWVGTLGQSVQRDCENAMEVMNRAPQAIFDLGG